MTRVLPALLVFFFIGAPALEARLVWRPGKGFQWEDKGRAESSEEQLRRAQEHYDAGRYHAALEEWHRVISLWEDEKCAKIARFMLAETFMKLELFESAAKAYREYLSLYPDVENRSEIIRKIADAGLALLGGARREFLGLKLFSGEGRGLEILRELLSDFPCEDFSDDIQYRIATHFFAKKDYENAKFEYLKLIECYPDSEWAEIAQFQLGMCEYLHYRGPDYDATPLIEAKRRFRIYLDHNPQGARHRDAAEMLLLLDELLAEKWLQSARFYHRTGKHGPSAVYLERIISEYPDTKAAQTAREMLNKNRADVPGVAPTTPQNPQGDK